MKLLRRKYKGITLIETTIYLGMFTVLFAVMMGFYFTIGEANQRAVSKLENQRASIFISQHTEEVVRNSDAFDESNSTYDTDLSTIRFTYGAGYLEYYVSNDTLYVTDGTDTYAITSPNLEVTKFRADVSEDSGTSLYRIDIEINFNDPDFTTLEEVLEVYFIIA